MRDNWGVPAFPLFSRPPPLEPPKEMEIHYLSPRRCPGGKRHTGGPLTFQTWLPSPGRLPSDWPQGRGGVAKPWPSVPRDWAPPVPASAGSILNSGGWSRPQEVLSPSSTAPSIKGVCAQATPPTWGWGLGGGGGRGCFEHSTTVRAGQTRLCAPAEGRRKRGWGQSVNGPPSCPAHASSPVLIPLP